MAQRFMVVGRKGYRDAMDAVQDPGFKPGACPVAEFETTARVNEFYQVTVWKREDEGRVSPVGKAFIRTFEELEDLARNGELVEFAKIDVFQFIARGEKAA